MSHFWGHDFGNTLTALSLWSQDVQLPTVQVGSPAQTPESLVFWICLFALNQHETVEEVGGNPQQGPFNAALAKATYGAVMVVDEQINPFRRIWCLFEVSRLKDLQRPFELISAMGSLSRPETFQEHPAAAEMLQNTGQALWEVSATSAESSRAADKYRIWQEISDKCWRSAIEAQGAKHFFVEAMQKGILHKYFLDFDHHVRSLLSSSILKLLLARGQHASAAKCCIHGASFSREQLEQICDSFQLESDQKGWLGQLLTRASDESVAELLLEHAADAGAANDYGSTALILAAAAGKEAVAKLLLKHGADVRAANKHKRNAIMAGAFAGHEAVVKLLLEHRADVKAADLSGRTALMGAAFGGHQAIVKLLLKHCADAKELSAALISAASAGQDGVAKLLLDNSADVGACRVGGRTALMDAAVGGHPTVAKLLLEHHADILAKDNRACTALMLVHAARHKPEGHEAVVRLLTANDGRWRMRAKIPSWFCYCS